MYVGWGLRKLRCECGRTFGKGSHAERVFGYETHWRETHAGGRNVTPISDVNPESWLVQHYRFLRSIGERPDRKSVV